VPDEKFPFSFAKLRGCRIAVPSVDSSIYKSSRKRLNEVFGKTAEELRNSETDKPLTDFKQEDLPGRQRGHGKREDSPFPYGSIELVISDERFPPTGPRRASTARDPNYSENSDSYGDETEETKLLGV
jgi:hypothetical protein